MGHLPGAQGQSSRRLELLGSLGCDLPSSAQVLCSEQPVPSIELLESLLVSASKPGSPAPGRPVRVGSGGMVADPEGSRAGGLRIKVVGVLRDRASCSRGPHGSESQRGPSPDPRFSPGRPQLEGCGDSGAAEVAGSSGGLHVCGGQGCPEGGGPGERFWALVWAAGHTSVTVGMPDPLGLGVAGPASGGGG